MERQTLVARLRAEAKRRVLAREFTATELGRRIGIKQSSISNFLNGKNGLTETNREKLRVALKLTEEDLQGPTSPLRNPNVQIVPIVNQQVAINQPGIPPRNCIGIETSAIRRRPLDEDNSRSIWTRFVAIRATRAQARFMHPLFSSADLLVIDRHELVFTAEKKDLHKIYAVADGTWVSIGYLKMVGNQTQLHPHQQPSSPILINLPPQRNPTHSIVGTVCNILLDVKKRTLAGP